MSKHTPGPWHFHDDPCENDVEVHAEYDDGQHRHHIVAVAKTHHWMGVELANAEANARLIAAAPWLLDACKAFVAANNAPMGSYLTRIEREALRLMQLAIAAAEGTEPENSNATSKD